MISNDVAEFEVGQIMGIAMTIGVTIVGIAYLLQVTGDVRDDMGEDSCSGRTDAYTQWNDTAKACSNGSANDRVGAEEFNGTSAGITALAKFPDKMGMIVTIIIAAIIIGILVRYLWVGGKR